MLCVLFSLMFWIFTSLSKDYETHIRVPVSYHNIPFTKYFDSELPNSLDFYFKGSGFKLAGVHFRSIPDSIKVDVAALSGSKQQLNIQTLSLRNQFPGELKPYKILPESIVAGYSSRQSKKVPVKFNGSISFRDRYDATSPVVLIPDSVELAGEKAVLDKVNSVRTESILWTDISGDKMGTLKLDSASFSGLATSVSNISYKLQVSEFTEGILELPIELPVSQRSSVTLLPNSVKISYTVALADYPQLHAEDFIAYTEVPFSETPLQLKVMLRTKPLSVRNVRIEPEFVDYLIRK